MTIEPVPFRIRVGLLGIPGTGIDLPGELASWGRRLIEIVQEEVPELLDEKSRRRLARAEETWLAYTIVTTSGDDLAHGILDAVDLPPELRRGLAPPSRGDTKTPRERLVDECDVLIVVSVDPLTDSELEGVLTSEVGLAYAAQRDRPVIGTSLRGHAVATIPREGLDARSISGLDLYNTWSMEEGEAERYRASVSRDLFGSASGDEGRPTDPAGAGPDEGTVPPDRSPHPGTAIPDPNRDAVRDLLIPHYVRASTIAKRFQRAYLSTARAVYALAVLAVALVAVGALVHPLSAIAYGVELAVLIAIFVMIRRAHRSRAHEKWLQTRFLAERLRHAMYLVACGVLPAGHRIPPHVGGREPPDLWMAMAFDEILARLRDLPPCDEEACPRLSDFARRSWLGGQLAYHRGKTRELQRKSARFERAGLWMFGTAMAVAAAHLALLVAHALHLGWLEPPWLEGGLTWLALVLPVAGASIGGFRAHREYSRLAKRSAAMVSALEDMAARLERVSNPEDLEAMLSQIESWMVEETQGWLLLMGPLKLEAV